MAARSKTQPRCATTTSVITARGFSLIELIIVITILGVLAVGLSGLYINGINQYLDATTRNELTAQARFALERISREVRNAVPNSLRVSSDGQCLEFLPLLGAGLYHSLPLGTPANELITTPFAAPGGALLTVMPMSPGDVYGSPPAAAAGIVASSALPGNEMRVTLDRALAFPLASPGQRFFLYSTPVSFCAHGDGSLRRYAGYGLQAAQPLPGAGLPGGDRLADRLLPLTPGGNGLFSYLPGNLTRNATLHVELTLSDRGEPLRYQHEVLIRNVP